MPHCSFHLWQTFHSGRKSKQVSSQSGRFKYIPYVFFLFLNITFTFMFCVIVFFSHVHFCVSTLNYLKFLLKSEIWIKDIKRGGRKQWKSQNPHPQEQQQVIGNAWNKLSAKCGETAVLKTNGNHKTTHSIFQKANLLSCKCGTWACNCYSAAENSTIQWFYKYPTTVISTLLFPLFFFCKSKGCINI